MPSPDHAPRGVHPPTVPGAPDAEPANVATATGAPAQAPDAEVDHAALAAAVDDLEAPAPRRSATRVLAVVVVHDGAPWLDRTLGALTAQTHRDLEVVAVDNGSTDDSRDRLIAHLGEERVLVADRDLGFGAAASMALDARAADDAPYVLLLHDDLELAPTAVSELAVALDDDPRLAVVGPKLLDWDDGRRLQSVGWTVDLTGRADSGVDEGELDQGQRDVDRRTLYVSTGGMVLRRAVFDELGRFDRRYHLFRDDLDLCWRVWLAGHDVEVVPEATAGHAAAATNYERLGQTAFIGPRYFAERNTLATLLKNYGLARLLPVVALYAVVGVAKVLGFVLTRRFSDAWQTVRAWLWNVLHLRETVRLRREVQAERRRTDRDLRVLFGRIAPRVRAYAEAIGSWIAGGDVDTVTPDPRPEVPSDPETATARLLGAIRARPVLIVGSILTVIVLVGAAPLLAPGPLRGGDLAPWPASATAFLGDHASAWHTAAGLGTDLAPSPAQALLGLLQLLTFGSGEIAARVLPLGTLLLAWVFALRATQRYSERKLPRVAAATAYILSPPALAALTTGEVGALVAMAALPGLVAAGGTLARRDTPPARAWRAAAGAALLGAIASAFVPVLLAVIVVAGAVLLLASLPSSPPGWRGPLAARIGLSSLGPAVLLLPWSARLLAADGPLAAGGGTPVADDLWRWVLLAPDVAGFPGPLAGIGFVLAGVLGLVLGWRRQAGLATLLWAVAVGGATLGWASARAGVDRWAGLPLLLSAAAYAGLLAVAFARGERTLGRHAFGWRQIAAGLTAVAVAVSIGTVALSLVQGPGDAYVRGRSALPQFVTAAASADDPFRVLVLADTGGEVVHEVVPGTGPSMAAFGVEPDPAATAVVDAAVTDLVTGRDVRTGAVLGRLGIRYVVVPDGGASARLDAALRAQPGLEPRPVSVGRVLAVSGALPRAAVVPPDAAAELATAGTLPSPEDVTPVAVGVDGRVTGRAPSSGVLLVTELANEAWEGRGGQRPLSRVDAPIVAFEVPAAGAQLDVGPATQGARALALTGQLLAVLLVVSLMLRPPGFARVATGPDRDGRGASS